MEHSPSIKSRIAAIFTVSCLAHGWHPYSRRCKVHSALFVRSTKTNLLKNRVQANTQLHRDDEYIWRYYHPFGTCGGKHSLLCESLRFRQILVASLCVFQVNFCRSGKSSNQPMILEGRKYKPGSMSYFIGQCYAVGSMAICWDNPLSSRSCSYL